MGRQWIFFQMPCALKRIENPLAPQLPGSPARIAAIPFKKMKMENEKWKIWERFRLWLKRLGSRVGNHAPVVPRHLICPPRHDKGVVPYIESLLRQQKGSTIFHFQLSIKKRGTVCFRPYLSYG